MLWRGKCTHTKYLSNSLNLKLLVFKVSLSTSYEIKGMSKSIPENICSFVWQVCVVLRMEGRSPAYTRQALYLWAIPTSSNSYWKDRMTYLNTVASFSVPTTRGSDMTRVPWTHDDERILQLALSSSILIFKWDVKLPFFFNYTWVCHQNPVNHLKISIAYVFLVRQWQMALPGNRT